MHTCVDGTDDDDNGEGGSNSIIGLGFYSFHPNEPTCR